jgi:hypothetical protein
MRGRCSRLGGCAASLVERDCPTMQADANGFVEGLKACFAELKDPRIAVAYRLENGSDLAD